MNANIKSDTFIAHVIARLEAANKTSDWLTVRKTMIAMGAKLQEGYKGRLQTMIPTDGGRKDMDPAKRLSLYVWMVLEVCDRHSRTAEQINAALDAVL